VADSEEQDSVEIRHVAGLDPANLARAYAIDAGALDAGHHVALVHNPETLRERFEAVLLNGSATFGARFGLNHVAGPNGRTLAVQVAFDISGHVFLLSPPAAHDLAAYLRGWAGVLTGRSAGSVREMADALDGRGEMARRHETGATVQ